MFSSVEWWSLPPHCHPTRLEVRDSGRAPPSQDCPLCGARVRSKLVSGFRGLCGCTVVSKYNTDVNNRLCAGGFVRAREWCLGAVRSRSLQGCERCEMTRGNDVMEACLTPKKMRGENIWSDNKEKRIIIVKIIEIFQKNEKILKIIFIKIKIMRIIF